MEPLELLSRLSSEMKAAISLGMGSAKDLSGVAASGDSTFGLDITAEETLYRCLEDLGFSGTCYSEDRGLVALGGPGPGRFLLVDPVDGTRPAAAGLESACISLALSEGTAGATLGKVRWAWVEEIRGPRAFCASAGEGTFILDRVSGERVPIALSGRQDITQLFYSFELVGRPVQWITRALGALIDDTALDGGCFVLNSSCFSMTRICTGQFDAHIDVAGRILEECPSAREEFLRCGKGRLIALFPYDVAAACLILREAGCRVTDASGRSLEGYPLLPEPGCRPLSLLAACTPELHEKLLTRIDEGLSSMR